MVCLCVAACSIAAVKMRKVLMKLALTAGLYVWNAQCLIQPVLLYQSLLAPERV